MCLAMVILIGVGMLLVRLVLVPPLIFRIQVRLPWFLTSKAIPKVGLIKWQPCGPKMSKLPKLRCPCGYKCLYWWRSPSNCRQLGTLIFLPPWWWFLLQGNCDPQLLVPRWFPWSSPAMDGWSAFRIRASTDCRYRGTKFNNLCIDTVIWQSARACQMGYWLAEAIIRLALSVLWFDSLNRCRRSNSHCSSVWALEWQIRQCKCKVHLKFEWPEYKHVVHWIVCWKRTSSSLGRAHCNAVMDMLSLVYA